jgi:hypothetical protein
VNEIHAGAHFEELRRQMIRAPDAGRPILKRSRLRGFHLRDKLAHRVRSDGFIENEDELKRGERLHGYEILLRIERKFLVEAGIHGERSAVRVKQRVAVRRRMRDELGRDVVIRTGPVVDHNRSVRAAGKAGAP